MDGTPEEVFSDPEKICSLGLNVPQSTQIALALKEKGIVLKEPVFTHERLLNAILRVKEAAVC